MKPIDNTYLAQITPVLPVGDVLEALDFYIKKLKFSLVYVDQERTPGYAVIRRNNIALHLQKQEFEKGKNPSNKTMTRVLVQGVEQLFKEYQLMGVFHNYTSLEEKPWGTIEFAFYDPYMNALIFYHPV